MTKGYATFVQHLYRQILVDLAVEIPELHKELGRDYIRLCSALEKQGLRFFTIDLVAMGKHFDTCLANAHLTPFVGPHSRRYKRGSVIPRLFRGLLRRVFQDSGEFVTHCDVLSIRALRQLYYAVKKLELECEDARTFKSVREFFQCDSKLPSSTLDWDADRFDGRDARNLQFRSCSDPAFERGQFLLPGIDEVSRVPTSLCHTLHFVADATASLIGEFNPYEWLGKHGPGAVSDQQKGVSKYEFPHWPVKLERIFPLADFAYANVGLWGEELIDKHFFFLESEGHSPLLSPAQRVRAELNSDSFSSKEETRFSSREPVSKLICVPKTQAGPRLIASEPVCNQWTQQLVRSFINSRVDSLPHGRAIRFNDQRFNQQAARRASIHADQWTIDLSAASDHVSCYVIERMFRRSPSLLNAFHACRTRLLLNEVDRKLPRISKLRKFSCMGSALTFPVQSLVFLNVVLACLIYQRRLKQSIKNISILCRQVHVYGDDLIVPNDVGYLVLGLLRHLSFEVNRSKTFGKGNFRESCGGEYFKGHDVTPTYLLSHPDRMHPESMVASVAVRNNFYRSGYDNVASFLKSTVCKEMKNLRLPTLHIGSGRLCWDTFGCSDVTGLKTRYNAALQRMETFAHDLRAVVKKGPDRYSSRLLQYFTESPDPMTNWKSGVNERPKFFLKLGWVPVA